MPAKGPSASLYPAYGVELTEANGSGQHVGHCPFCDREDHFYVDADTAQYHCKDSSCDAKGNAYTFLSKYYQMCLEETTPAHLKKLAEARNGLNLAAFVQARIAYSKALEKWLIPVRNVKGAMTNLLRYSGEGPPYGAPGCSQHLWGLDTLEPEGPVFICEGQWDAIALRWLMRRLDSPPDSWTVLGAPGATTMPKADLPLLQNREVILLYDNDDAGRMGLKVAAKKLRQVAQTVHVMVWPDGQYKDKYDIEDLIRESPERPDTVFQDLLSWSFLYEEGADPTTAPPELTRNTVEEVIADYCDTGIHMYDGLKDLLTLSLAVIVSAKLQGEPLWMYAIGDPGAGKSLVLESTLGSKGCLYRTSVTCKSFLTGWKHGEEDNSLLAYLPGKSLIVKDYSNVLSLPHIEQDQLVSLLREAYDGRIVRTYGNGVFREYPPPGSSHRDCRFSFVAGVTKEIHSRSHAGLGERFLKYEIPRTEDDNLRAIRAALDDSWKSHENQNRRTASVAAFLDRPIDLSTLPTIPGWLSERLAALSQFVGYSRSVVSRSKGDLDYAPSAEAGTRVAKQLKKLSESVSVVLNLREANEEVYRLVKKVAWDTAHSWRRDLLRFFYEKGETSGLAVIADASGLTQSTTHRELQDMIALKVMTKRKDDGELKWKLKPRITELMKIAQLESV